MVEKEGVEKEGVDVLGDFLKDHKDIKKSKSHESVNVDRIKHVVGVGERIVSGINGFDELIGGGFKKGSNVLVEGGPGTGKTIFGIQFLMKAIEDGKSAVYFSFEENKEDLYEDMKLFGWDLEKLESEKKFFYIHYTPEQITGILSEGGGTLDSFMRQINPTRLVIDSITAFTLLGSDELKKRENVLALFDLIDKWNCTTIFTFQHASEGEEEHKTASFMEFEVDGIILLYYARKGILGEGRERKIEVLKMRGTDHARGAVTFDVGENGIVIVE
ncbi:DUF2075 domain-containing protein [Candidatus Woesearchaeota archaeon]|nr:DUF2075 domain-containing protein [Candidatus Woesearchaeota archaeon]